jgi:peptidyl serine alpha-galactosyltransferase
MSHNRFGGMRRQKRVTFLLLLFLVVIVAWLWSVNLRVLIVANDGFTNVGSLSLGQGWTVNEPLGNDREETPRGVDINVKKKKNHTSNNTNLHIVFSTGCSAFQDWQSYLFFYHAKKSGQRGKVTRVASGCESTNAEATLLQNHHEQVAVLSSQFHLHVTPNYARVMPGMDYKFFNKPFGLRHWMEQELGFPLTRTYDNTVFIILDPDQLILRPFEADFGGHQAASKIQWHTTQQELRAAPAEPIRVEHGRPFAQYYDMMGLWVDTIYDNRTHILASLATTTTQNSTTATTASALHTHWTRDRAYQHYVPGPPYLATGRDMYQIVATWATFAVPVYEVTRDHLSEMYAYAAAAGHLNLPHELAYSFMVSNIEVKREGWSWVDSHLANSTSAVCEARDHYTATVKAVAPQYYLPNVLHFCQRYHLGPYFFSKYILPKNILTCEHALLVEPPVDIADTYSTSLTPNGELNAIPNQLHRNRMAFMLCHMIAGLNEAVLYWKQHHCNKVTIANVNKTFLFKPKTKKI